MKKHILALSIATSLFATLTNAAPLPEASDFKNFGVYEGVDAQNHPCLLQVETGTSSYRAGDLSRHVSVKFHDTIGFRLYFSAIVEGEGDMPTNAFYRDSHFTTYFKTNEPPIAWSFSHLNPNSTMAWSLGGYDPRIKAAATIDLYNKKSVAVLITKPVSRNDETFFVCQNLKQTIPGKFYLDGSRLLWKDVY